MKITYVQPNQPPVVYDLTTETLEMRVIELEREVDRLSEMVTTLMMRGK